MKKIVLFISNLFWIFYCFGQPLNNSHNSFDFSINMQYLNSYGVYYTLGNRMSSEGKNMNLGYNIGYSRSIKENIYFKAQIGFRNQKFSISRPFKFNTQNSILYSTESYSYSIFKNLIGLGYSNKLKNQFSYSFLGYYSFDYSFKQKYIVNTANNLSQTESNFMPVCNSVGIQSSLLVSLNSKIAFGLIVDCPFFVKWKNDDIFIKYDYSDDSQVIAKNKFNISFGLSTLYNF